MKSRMRSDKCDAAGLRCEPAREADRQLAEGLTFSAAVTALVRRVAGSRRHRADGRAGQVPRHGVESSAFATPPVFSRFLSFNRKPNTTRSRHLFSLPFFVHPPVAACADRVDDGGLPSAVRCAAAVFAVDDAVDPLVASPSAFAFLFSRRPFFLLVFFALLCCRSLRCSCQSHRSDRHGTVTLLHVRLSSGEGRASCYAADRLHCHDQRPLPARPVSSRCSRSHAALLLLLRLGSPKDTSSNLTTRHHHTLMHHRTCTGCCC